MGADTRDITVYIDGWSQLAAGSREISVAGINKDGKAVRSSSTLNPVRAEELKELDPEMLRVLVGRLIDTGRGYACEGGVCRQEDGSTVNAAEMLANPASIPGLGDMYQAWGMETSLWRADLKVGQDSETMVVSIGNAVSGAFESGTGYIQVEDELLLGAGLGTVFKLTPNWIDEPVPYNLFLPQVGIEAGDYESVGKLEESIMDAAGRGLARGAGALADLARSELTFLTSPTTGCGGWVTCVPGSAEIEVVSRTRTPLGLHCVPDAEGEAAGTPVGVTIVDETRNVVFEKPAHQFGAWNGSSAGELPGGGEDMLWGVPPLVEGEQTFRVVTAFIWDGAMGGRLIGTAGYLAQDGYDPMDREVDLEYLVGPVFEPCG